jgi:hypothetical protein
MTWYPQIGAGALAQFPFKRTRKWRSILNVLENGERIALPDSAADQIQWQLTYRDLSGGEANKLRDLFVASQGQFRSFTFFDPIANLLGWSEDLARPDWETGLLQKLNGAADPLGTARAWRVSNPAAGEQELSQTLAIPGNVAACFSAYVRSDVPGRIVIRRDVTKMNGSVGSTWTRVSVGGTGDSATTQATFAITLSPGQSIEVWGLQVEAQPFASQYKQTGPASGIYEETYFASDELMVISTGLDLYACDVTLVSRI